MRRFLIPALVALLLCSLRAPARAADEPLLKKGDRVVLFGDSITEQKIYTRYLQQYVYCRHPDLDIRFFNAGWGGDTVPGAMGRFERDVMPLAPTVVTLFFGMNDGGYKKKEDAAVTVFKTQLSELVKALKQKGLRVVVFGPGCIDPAKLQRGPPEYDLMLEALSQAS